MRVLVACEYSGVVREAFRAKGHDAFSVDLLPAEDDSPYHEQDDVLNVLGRGEPWDLMIAHPPCTYLCNSGVRWLVEEDENGWVNTERWESLEAARAFFMALWGQPIPRICIENPVPHKYGMLPKYSQTIQPYQFGDDASKRTCLWLKGLEPLSIPEESQWVKPRIVWNENHKGEYVQRARWSNQTDGGQNKLGPSEQRAHERSRTYQGIADAFASNWG